tara:strand:- start:327 stop:512 length:186 start_codon:yes stop_codon:yes gene_type:complete
LKAKVIKQLRSLSGVSVVADIAREQVKAQRWNEFINRNDYLSAQDLADLIMLKIEQNRGSK